MARGPRHVQRVTALLPGAVAQIDDEAHRLERLLARSDETVLCFLGISGIGKSTLLNALVAGAATVVPAGGTGPLTAIAAEVRYSAQPYFNVLYHPIGKLRGILLQLEREALLSGQASPGSIADAQDARVEEGVLLDLPASAPADPTEAGELVRSRSERLAALIRTAQVLVRGEHPEPPPDLAYLAAALRHALGLRTDVPVMEQDGARISALAATLGRARSGAAHRVSESDLGPTQFARALREHAAGSLAPLVKRIEVGWPSALLREGLVLVDLPGVGVAGDEFQLATQEYIGRRARGVILAVRRGVTEPEIDLIRSTGFWERALLAAGDAEADPCSLVVAVTHVDSLVEHRIMDGEPDAESVAACYRSVRDELTHVIKQQTRAELAKLSEVEGADPGMRESRERASREILEGLQVCPVSAFDYRKLATENPRLPPLAGTAEDTGIPTLARHLAEIGARNRESLRALRQDSADRLVSIAQAAIDQAIASWTEGTRQQAEATRLRAELGRFLDPIRRARGSLRGQFREFLDHTAAILIGWMVERAQADARKRVGRYLDGLRDAPWATLKAAVCRGGTFDGARRIDLPHDIAQHFQEPTAAAWGGTDGVLQEVRKRTGAYGEATSALVGEILEWAKSWSGEPVSPEILAALERGADARAKQLGQIGREAADELRKAVRDKLLATTKPRIALACQEFVRRGDAQGRGVKLRMLELFAGLADDSVSAASEVAHALLQERFNEVRAEIFRILEVCGDPIESAGEAIAPAEQRADDDRRADIIGRLRAARPTPTAEPV